MSLDRQSTWLLCLWIVAAPFVAAVFVWGAWDQWHSDVWLRGPHCGRGYCVRSPGQDAFSNAMMAVVALGVAGLMTLKALRKPIFSRSNLTKAARAICAASLLITGLAFAAMAWALANLP